MSAFAISTVAVAARREPGATGRCMMQHMDNSRQDCRNSTRLGRRQAARHRGRLLHHDRRRHIGGVGIDRRRVEIPEPVEHPPPGEAAVVPVMDPAATLPVRALLGAELMEIPAMVVATMGRLPMFLRSMAVLLRLHMGWGRGKKCRKAEDAGDTGPDAMAHENGFSNCRATLYHGGAATLDPRQGRRAAVGHLPCSPLPSGESLPADLFRRSRCVGTPDQGLTATATLYQLVQRLTLGWFAPAVRPGHDGRRVFVPYVDLSAGCDSAPSPHPHPPRRPAEVRPMPAQQPPPAPGFARRGGIPGSATGGWRPTQ